VRAPPATIPAPPFPRGLTWLNVAPLRMDKQKGRPVLVEFWDFCRVNSLRTLPYLKAWHERYADAGLRVVGIHTGAFPPSRDEAEIEAAVRRLGIEYPVALDNDLGTWNAFQNQYWPTKYLIDRNGHLRYYHFGEGDYDTTEARIRTLLGESAGMLPVSAKLSDPTPKTALTPETYLGYFRLQPLLQSTIAPKQFANYEFPNRPLQQSELAYSGTWKVNPDEIVAALGARLRLHFIARKVHLVLGGRGSVGVFLDGKLERTVRVDGSRLYTLLRLPSLRSGLLELRFSPGVRGYAFTFG
jgi:hypothetical protein